jgi:predicted nucleic acid-binding protein
LVAQSAQCAKGESDVSVYEIRVQGRLDQHWAAWFEGLTLTYEGDDTVLRGSLADEAALHGVLTKIGNLNLHLLAVHAIETGGEVSAANGPPSEPGSDTPSPPRKRKSGAPRKHRPKRSTS